MDVRSPSSSNATEKSENPNSSKQAACLNCRRSKTRCLRNPGDLKCRKCLQNESDCVVPEYRVGRKKGIKNKRDGLEKAVYRIEQAIKKSKTRESRDGDDENTRHLETLLTEAQNLLPRSPSSNLDPALSNHDTPTQLQIHLAQNHLEPAMAGSNPSESHNPDDHFAVDDAENPLQLLARASDLSGPQHQTANSPHITNMVASSRHAVHLKDRGLQDFFGPFRPSLDTGPDVDPQELGLVTDEESAALFTYFYESLSHTRWGLDPLLHTPDFVRKRSSFLFTSIMAASALFIPTAAALSKRLQSHCKTLAHKLVANRNRSPEIVLGFIVNIPWMAPGEHWSDDETCSYMASALTIAMDLSLNKLIVPSPTQSIGHIHEGKVSSDCITARKALDLDGFQDVNPSSDFGQRLLRRRERIWLALFVLDRGVCLSRGRSFTVPLTSIIEHCENWHQSPIADIWDGSLVSSVTLRRDLVTLISEVKKTCDSNSAYTISGSTIAQSVQDMIDGFFDNWYATWAAFATGRLKDNPIPPYVEILVTHGRLSVYSSVINHPTAPIEVKRFFRAAGLSSALNVLRAAVQGERRLKSMPNNTAIMISFAACFAFYLGTMGGGSSGNMSLAPSIRRLIEESADVLERIGSSPPHRNGTSALYGRHLREVVGSASSDGSYAQSSTQTFPLQNTQIPPIQGFADGTEMVPIEASEQLLQFSAMSDEQIIDAINNVEQDLETYFPNFDIDDKAGLDWLDWFNMEVN